MSRNMRSNFTFYTELLISEECMCENEKKRGFAFCYSCYKKLPKFMQRSLFRNIGNGFCRAYDKALRFLNED